MRPALQTLRMLATAGTLAIAAPAAHAQLNAETVPEAARGIDFNQVLNAQLDPELHFMDAGGMRRQLGDYLGKKPLVLALVYYECPGICTLTLNGLLDCIKEMDLDLGSDYEVLTVSFDHRETHVLARKKREAYLRELSVPADQARGWHFLVGDEAAVTALTSSVGFNYRYVPEQDEFAHRAGLVIITPEGRVSRYYPGVMYDAATVRLGLIEAADGKIGTLADKLFLTCFHFDPATGKYTVAILRVINIACGATVLIVGGLVGSLYLRERRRRTPSVARS